MRPAVQSTAQLRRTRCYVAWGANLKGRLFFLGSSGLAAVRGEEDAEHDYHG